MPPRLTDILNTVLQYEKDKPTNVRAHVERTDPALRYCVTWGEGRYVEGTLGNWAEVLAVFATDPRHLRNSVRDWDQLIRSMTTIEVPGNEFEEWDQMTNPTNITVNRFGGRSRARARPDLLAGLVEEPLEPPPEPKRAIDRIIDGDLKLSGDDD